MSSKVEATATPDFHPPGATGRPEAGSLAWDGLAALPPGLAEPAIRMLRKIEECLASGRQRFLLVFRFASVNIAAAALVVVAYLHGYVGDAFRAGQSGVGAVIAIVFLLGLAISGVRVWQTSRDLNEIESGNAQVCSLADHYLDRVSWRGAESRLLLAANLRLELANRIGIVRHVANALVLLGLIGTVIGFIIAMQAVDGAADPDGAARMVRNLVDGMSVALYTTLLGAILNLWLTVNYNMLATGTVRLVTRLVELGEGHAGS